MTDPASLVECRACGTRLPRDEMFGLEPELHCPDCAHGVRKRLQARVRPHIRERKPVVTYFCLAVSVVLFVFTDFVYTPGSQRVMPDWLAGLHQWFPIWDGEVWRHLGCVFLHGGWLHILMNGLTLWYLGRAVETGWGHATMAGLMVGTGMAASAAQWMFSGPGVGLSGALFGLCGFMWALRRDHPIAAAVMNPRTIRWLLTLLVLGVILSASGRMAIGNWAHGVGLASGFAFGLAARHRRRRLLVPAVSLLAVGLVVASVYFAFGSLRLANGRSIPLSELRKEYVETLRGGNAGR